MQLKPGRQHTKAASGLYTQYGLIRILSSGVGLCLNGNCFGRSLQNIYSLDIFTPNLKDSGLRQFLLYVSGKKHYYFHVLAISNIDV